MSRRNLTLLISAILVSMVCYARNVQDPHARYVAEAYREIDAWSLEKPADDELVAGAMRGMVETLRRRGDQHSDYVEPRKATPFREEMRQEFGGVGVRIGFQGDPLRLTVIGPPEPGTPAFNAGIRAGDVITAIDGAETSGMGMSDVLQSMRGPVDAKVVLNILRETANDAGIAKEEKSIHLIRQIIQVPSVIGDQRRANGEWTFLLDKQNESDPQIAYLRISSFGNRTADELNEVLPQLLADGTEALIIDLRENPGGALDVAVEACNLFLPPGAKIVETRGRDGVVQTSYLAEGGPFTQLPLAVLINHNSASAAEIMAACFQDNKRAVVVGERSYGKGTVQRLVPMESGRSLLMLTSASYWRPSGVNIHRLAGTPEDAPWGVSPNSGSEVLLDELAYRQWIEARQQRDLAILSETPVVDPTDDATVWNDPVLQRASEHLRGE